MSVFVNLMILGALAGTAAIILGGVLGFLVLPNAVNDRIEEKVRLGLSDAYRNWEKQPGNLTVKFYFFDVQNPQGIMTGSAPRLLQKGPVVYKQQRIKENIKWDAESDVFTYDQRVINEYQEDSVIKENTEITTLNILKLLTLSILEESALAIKDPTTFEQLFSNTPKDSLFHKVSIADFIKHGTKSFEKSKVISVDALIVKNLVGSKLAEKVQLQPSSDGSYYLFSLLKHKLNYIENTYEMYGGVKNISEQGKFQKINNHKFLSVWPKIDSKNVCNQFKGTDPYLFPTNIDVDEEMTLFNSDLCRSIDYAFTEEVEIDDLKGQRLILKSENFANKTMEPQNECFCIEDGEKCLPQGFLNLKTCHGLPIIASQPHFLYCESKYSEMMNLEPKLDEHVSFIDIHAESGSLLRATKRTQYNMKLTSFKNFNPKTKSIILPLFWMEEIMEVAPKTMDMLQDSYVAELVVIEGVKWGLLVGGTVLVLGCIAAYGLSKLNLNKKS